MLKIEHLSKYYKGKRVLHDISLTIEKGRLYALVGNNGAGKTTLLNCIAAQTKAEEGKVLFHEHEVTYKDLDNIAYFVDHTLHDGSEKVKDIFTEYQFFFHDFNMERMQQFIIDLDINEDYTLSEMSLGTRKKCELAFVLARDAQLYLLDEPFANLDPLIRSELMKMIVCYSREDASYIISTHLVSEIETYMDDTMFIKDGSLILFGKNDDLRDEYQCDISELLIQKLAQE